MIILKAKAISYVDARKQKLQSPVATFGEKVHLLEWRNGERAVRKTTCCSATEWGGLTCYRLVLTLGCHQGSGGGLYLLVQEVCEVHGLSCKLKNV